MAGISRRRFTQIVSSAGLAGTALLEKMFAEAQSSGTITRDSVTSFLDLSGMTVRDGQMEALQSSLERAIAGMQSIRGRNVAYSVEPALTFRARR